MTTPGEDLRFRLLVEAPDYCTDNCQQLASFLIELSEEVDKGAMNPSVAQSPLISMVNACPKAVEMGSHSQGTAAKALTELNSMISKRPGSEQHPCILSTTASWHAISYARGEDPYDGFLDYDDDDTMD